MFLIGFIQDSRLKSGVFFLSFALVVACVLEASIDAGVNTPEIPVLLPVHAPMPSNQEETKLASRHRAVFPMVLFDQTAMLAEHDEKSLLSWYQRGWVTWAPLLEEKRKIDRFHKLQALGIPVILMDVKSGNWPYSDSASSPANDPLQDLATWQQVASRVRSGLTSLKQNGIRVDGVWTDWEGYPFRWEPQSSSDDRWEEPFLATRYRTTVWHLLLSTYLAAPVREVFPDASVAQWGILLSSREMPTETWENKQSGLFLPTLFTHTNPVAYGNSRFFREQWPHGNWPRDQQSVDRAYTHLMLRQVSQDAWNRSRELPWMGAIPWVARRVRDDPDSDIPEMSREAYRESLRHLWLRGISGMMVFNHRLEGDGQDPSSEIEDAESVYSEVVGYFEHLAKSKPINLAVPGISEGGVLWSAAQGPHGVLYRVFHAFDDPVLVQLPRPGGSPLILSVPPGGIWHLEPHQL